MNIAKKFVDALKEKKKTSPYDTTAQIKRIEGNTAWVHIPGGVDETPVKMTINASVGETVQVRVADGTAFLVGNASAPPTDDYTANIAIGTADEAKEEVTILENVVTENLAAINARFGNVEADTAKIHNLTANELTASVGYIADLTADEVTAQDISAATGYIGELTADSVTAQDISAATGYIDDLTANNITAQNIITDHATIGDLDSNYAHITNGVIDNAKIGYADVNDLSANYAHLANGVIDNATISYAKVNNLATNYAKIDATNINTATIRNAWVNAMMVQSGLIAHEGTVYTLDAIKVNASNITAGTIDVERLIVTVDGEKYMVHINPSTGTPTYEKLDGDIIEDLTITADKIVAGAITAQKITTENIVGSGGWINLRNGTFSYVNATSGDGISWDGTNLTINSASFVSNVSNKFSSQNLLPGIYRREYLAGPEWTSNGITWTVNNDGSVTATGEATANVSYHLTTYVLDGVPPVITIDPDKRYTLSGCPPNGSTTKYRMFARYTSEGTEPSSSSGSLVYEYGTGHTTVSARKYVAVGCQILSGYKCPDGGITFYPMLEVGDTKHNYVSSHSSEGALHSSIMQNADDISLRVQKNDVINQINLSTEGATISANRVNIEGATIFTNGRLSQSSLNNAYDAKGAADTAESNAKNYAASKSDAVAEEQIIYISKAAGTTSVSGTTTWVTESGDKQNKWTLKRPTFDSSYPVLFVAKQRKTVSNTVTCTTPIKDDTTTVIDGGNIITGTVTATQLASNSVTADKIKAGEITIGKIASDAQEDILNDNINIGGRNLMRNTYDPGISPVASRPNINGDTTNGYLRASTALTLAEHGMRDTVSSAKRPYIYFGENTAGTGMHGLEPGKTYTWSFDWTAKILSGSPDSGTNYYLRSYFSHIPSGSSEVVTVYQNIHTYKTTDLSDRGTSISGRCEYTFTIPSDATTTRLLLSCNSTSNPEYYASGDFVEMRNIKLEEGNKASAWSPAPEDTIAEGGKTATSYLTTISGTSGISVHDANDTSNFVNMNSSGVKIYQNGTKVADFGSTITLGEESDIHTVITNKGFDIVRSTSTNQTQLAHFGYDIGNDDDEQEVTAPFYTLGTRQDSDTFGIGNYSLVEGIGNIAAGSSSHAEGEGTKATKQASHAEGGQTVASAPYAHAEGESTTAAGKASHASGLGTFAKGYAQTVIGRYNNPETYMPDDYGQYSFAIGNGTANNARSNAMTVDWDGVITHQTGKPLPTLSYGTCDTAAATVTKVITLAADMNFTLTPGSIIGVKFDATNTAQSPYFAIKRGNTVIGEPKSVWYNTAQITTGSLGAAGTANRPSFYMYDGSRWVFLSWAVDSNTTYTPASLGFGYGANNESSSTTARTVNISNYTLGVGGIVTIHFVNAVPANATLNIRTRGAKPIHYHGGAITSGVITAQKTATFIYDGSAYNLIGLI